MYRGVRDKLLEIRVDNKSSSLFLPANNQQQWPSSILIWQRNRTTTATVIPRVKFRISGLAAMVYIVYFCILFVRHLLQVFYRIVTVISARKLYIIIRTQNAALVHSTIFWAGALERRSARKGDRGSHQNRSYDGQRQ